MLKLQRVYASESGPWDQTTGAKQISFSINSQQDADLSRSYVVLRTSLAVNAHPTEPCVRMPSFGYMNDQNAQRLPVAYSASSMLRDAQVQSEKLGQMEAIAFNNYIRGGLRANTVSCSENMVRNVFGEGWSPLMASVGDYNGAYNDGNYTSAWLNAQRTGAVASTLYPYVDMVVPLSEVLGIGSFDRLPLSRLGQTTLSFSIEEQATLASVFTRDDISGYTPYDYTYVDATHISVQTSARNADGECPFWVGQGLTITNGAAAVFQTNIANIALADTGVVTLTIGVDVVNNGTLVERSLDAAETVAWSITRASLILATMPSLPKAAVPKALEMLTWADIPYTPSTSTLISNSFSLPTGTVAAFFINSDGAIASLLNSMVRYRFSLNNKDLTNRSVQVFPSSSIAKDNTSKALQAAGLQLASFDQDLYTALPCCVLPAPSMPGDQLQLNIDLSAPHNGGRCHLACLVVKSMAV